MISCHFRRKSRSSPEKESCFTKNLEGLRDWLYISRLHGCTTKLLTRLLLTIELSKIYIRFLETRQNFRTQHPHNVRFSREVHTKTFGCHRRNLVSELLKPGSGKAIRIWHDSSVFSLFKRFKYLLVSLIDRHTLFKSRLPPIDLARRLRELACQKYHSHWRKIANSGQAV